MLKRRNTILTIISAALLVGLLYYLHFNRTGNGMLISILQKSAILALVAVSMNLLNGFTGLFSLG
ncbi:MAG: branched-chain amino acid ABC transporter permease, partial [Sphaerochaetaceae bacterium]